VLIARSGFARRRAQSAFALSFPRRDPAVTTSDSRRINRGAVPAGNTRGVSPLGASTNLTILAVATPITGYPADHATAAGGQPRHRSATVRTDASPHRGQPVNPPANTKRWLRQCEDLATEDPGRATLRVAVASGSADPQRTVDTRPLRPTDPSWVDGFRLVSRLGAGGMADVFYAMAPTGRPVVMKILRASGGGPEACQREFRLAYSVDADCTAPAIGYGVAKAGAYLVTAYLPGYRCGTTLVGSAMSTERLWMLGSALARVLATVHARGIVHCDVKPSNLLVRGHDVRVIDFGIARYIGEQCGDDGIVQCSIGWASPEQLRTSPATPAVDVFAWGCLIAQLAGVQPFASQSDQEWFLRVQSAEPDLSGLPTGMDEVIRRTLARDPRDRPSARELAAICRGAVTDPRDRLTGGKRWPHG
jgi:Protein kinase domain